MKALFKFIFNVLRTLSLIIVLGVVGIVVFFSYNEEAAESLLKALEEEAPKAMSMPHEEILYETGVDDEDFYIESFEEVTANNYNAKKYEIPIKEGSVYLRPSEIMYVDIKNRTCFLKMTTGETIKPNLSLTDLYELLNKGESVSFFKTKSSILNCHYVQKIVREKYYHSGYKYNYYSIMNDSEKIKLSEDKVKDLKRELEALTF